MKKIKIIALFFTVCLFSNFADVSVTNLDIDKRLSAVLDAKITKELVEKGFFIKAKYGASNMKPELQPDTDIAKKILAKSIIKKPIFLAEALYLYKKYGNENPDMAKILRNISALEGVEYYSHRSEQYFPLYTKIRTVKKTENGYEEIPEELEGELDGAKVLALQSDLGFGDDKIYSYEYFRDGKDMGMTCLNNDTLRHHRYSFVSISPQSICLSLMVFDFDDYILVYCSSTAKFPMVPFIGSRLKNSFSSRLNAIYNWFINRYMEEEKKLSFK